MVLIRAGRGLRAAATALALPAALTAAVALGGALATARGSAAVATQPVMVVQTNVPPAYRWTEAYAERQLGAHLAASEAGTRTAHPALIVWPEHVCGEVARILVTGLVVGGDRHLGCHVRNLCPTP